MLVENFQVSVGVLLGIVLAVTGIFVFSKPMMDRSPIDGTMLTVPADRHYPAWTVRRVFETHGLEVDDAATAYTGVTLSGAIEGLYVFVAKHDEDATPRDDAAFERRVGNVLVHYGGSDRSVLARVKAAVGALRRS
jgi:hypothetical protein